MIINSLKKTLLKKLNNGKKTNSIIPPDYPVYFFLLNTL
jgi:hypothetical protein